MDKATFERIKNNPELFEKLKNSEDPRFQDLFQRFQDYEANWKKKSDPKIGETSLEKKSKKGWDSWSVNARAKALHDMYKDQIDINEALDIARDTPRQAKEMFKMKGKWEEGFFQPWEMVKAGVGDLSTLAGRGVASLPSMLKDGYEGMTESMGQIKAPEREGLLGGALQVGEEVLRSPSTPWGYGFGRLATKTAPTLIKNFAPKITGPSVSAKASREILTELGGTTTGALLGQQLSGDDVTGGDLLIEGGTAVLPWVKPLTKGMGGMSKQYGRESLSKFPFSKADVEDAIAFPYTPKAKAFNERLAKGVQDYGLPDDVTGEYTGGMATEITRNIGEQRDLLNDPSKWAKVDEALEAMKGKGAMDTGDLMGTLDESIGKYSGKVESAGDILTNDQRDKLKSMVKTEKIKTVAFDPKTLTPIKKVPEPESLLKGQRVQGSSELATMKALKGIKKKFEEADLYLTPKAYYETRKKGVDKDINWDKLSTESQDAISKELFTLRTKMKNNLLERASQFGEVGKEYAKVLDDYHKKMEAIEGLSPFTNALPHLQEDRVRRLINKAPKNQYAKKALKDYDEMFGTDYTQRAKDIELSRNFGFMGEIPLQAIGNTGRTPLKEFYKLGLPSSPKTFFRLYAPTAEKISSLGGLGPSKEVGDFSRPFVREWLKQEK